MSRRPEPPPIASSAKARAVYLLCDQPDLRQEQLEKIKGYLRSRGHPVELPPFQGEPDELRAMEEELIGDTDGALIYYGTAKDLWVLRKRKNVLKVLSSKQKGRDYVRGLYLATPKDDIKAVNYLTVSDRVYPESEGFPPLLLLGDCEEFQPEKLDSFIQEHPEDEILVIPRRNYVLRHLEPTRLALLAVAIFEFFGQSHPVGHPGVSEFRRPSRLWRLLSENRLWNPKRSLLQDSH